MPTRSPAESPSRASAWASWRERSSTAAHVVRCRSPSTRLLTISVSPECRAACWINEEISSGIDIIWPISAMRVSWIWFGASPCPAPRAAVIRTLADPLSDQSIGGSARLASP